MIRVDLVPQWYRYGIDDTVPSTVIWISRNGLERTLARLFLLLLIRERGLLVTTRPVVRVRCTMQLCFLPVSLLISRISKAYPLFQAEPHPPMYRDARANGFLNYPHFGNGHRTGAPKANGVLMPISSVS